MSSDLRMIKRLPISLRNSFWIELFEAVEEELLRLKAAIEIKNTLYDVNTADYTRLLELSELLGVLFNATVDDSVDFLRREVEAIPFKIKNKSTMKLYKSFFKSLNRIGEVFVYYFKTSSNNIVRNSSNILLGMNLQDPLLPRLHTSTGDFTGYVEDAVKLDQSPIQILDIQNEEGDYWTLDTVDTQISTNHLALEYFIDRLITKHVRNENDILVEKEFLMTWDFMDFISVNTNFSRRAKEVPHVGCQLSVLMDSSGYFNPLDDYYSQPSIKTKALIDTIVFSELTSVFDISYMEFGIGSQSDLTSRLGGGSFPTELKQRVARNFIFFDEKYETDSWMAVSAEYKGQQINTFILHDDTGYLLDNDPEGAGVVDGSNNDFEGTLLFAPLRKQNIRFEFVNNGSISEITDDGQGNLIGNKAYGTIDYNTGKYVFSTDIDFRDEEILFTGDGILDEFEVTISPTKTPILNSTENSLVSLRYNIGERWYLVYDDGLGNFTADNIISGTINYTTGTVNIIFSEPITKDREVTMFFQYNKVSPPDVDTEIKVDYYFTFQTIEITEAAIFDNEDRMIGYATFPPLEFNTSEHHVNLDFYIKKSTFS